MSKTDLPRAWEPGDLTAQAQATGRGVCADGRRARSIFAAASSSALADRDELRDPPAISNVRHLALVDEARGAIARAVSALDAGATEELVLTDLAAARRALEEITGRRTPDDLLQHIFSRFCVGK